MVFGLKTIQELSRQNRECNERWLLPTQMNSDLCAGLDSRATGLVLVVPQDGTLQTGLRKTSSQNLLQGHLDNSLFGLGVLKLMFGGMMPFSRARTALIRLVRPLAPSEWPTFGLTFPKQQMSIFMCLSNYCRFHLQSRCRLLTRLRTHEQLRSLREGLQRMCPCHGTLHKAYGASRAGAPTERTSAE